MKISDVLGPKIASGAILNEKNFLGEHAPAPSSFCVHAKVCTRPQVPVSWTNAILLPPGLTLGDACQLDLTSFFQPCAFTQPA